MKHQYGDMLRSWLAKIDLPELSLGGKFVVLGSAPRLVLPRGFDDSWGLLSVNAAQASLSRVGCYRVPDVTVVSDQMLGDSPANIAGKKAIENLRTKKLVLVRRGFSVESSVEVLEMLGYKYESLFVIDHWQRSKIVFSLLRQHLALGGGERKVSTGVFSALLARYLGAETVVLAGIVPGSCGHFYNDLVHPRAHTNVDIKALGLARDKGLKFYCSEQESAVACGLPIW